MSADKALNWFQSLIKALEKMVSSNEKNAGIWIDREKEQTKKDKEQKK